MARKSNRKAHGEGTIRQRVDGAWEARYTSGRDPKTGKQVQKSIYGKTQEEVLRKLQKVCVAVGEGTYIEPSQMTVSDWLCVWEEGYLGNVKPVTWELYCGYIRNHINPALGHVLLQALNPHNIQLLYNKLQRKGRAPKTVRDIHGVLHGALDQAVKLGYVKVNPSKACTLPRWVKKEMQVLSGAKISKFLQE